MTLKPYDVVTYTFEGRTVEMIIDHVDGDAIFSRAARIVGETDIYDYGPGGSQLSDDGDIIGLRLHPEPDDMWTAFVAKLLIEGEP